MASGAAPKADLLEIVEAAYDLETSDLEWLKRLTEAARPHLDEGFGLATFQFYRPDDGPPRIVERCYLGIPDELAKIYPLVFSSMDPELRTRPFRMGPCITGSQLMGMREEFRDEPHMKRYVHAFGMYDSMWITAAEPSGHGCGFHAGRARIAWASPSQVQRWGRIAAHVSAAARLRHRLRALGASEPPRPSALAPDAVFDTNGDVRESSAATCTEAVLDQLRRAVLDLERVRGPMRLTDPDKALAGWKGLVAGRWSLIDQMEHDGRRYIVARENEPTARGPESFTQRERQVIQYARLGHSNKEIAYDLGIDASTVRVLLARAAGRLGVRGRAALLNAFPG